MTSSWCEIITTIISDLTYRKLRINYSEEHNTWGPGQLYFNHFGNYDSGI